MRRKKRIAMEERIAIEEKIKRDNAWRMFWDRIDREIKADKELNYKLLGNN